MADKTVRIENFPATESSGSPQRVAWDMAIYLFRATDGSKSSGNKAKALLDLYAECLDATTGRREYTSAYSD